MALYIDMETESLEFYIEAKAKKFIDKKTKDATINIKYFEVSNCCVPLAEPYVEIGRPEELGNLKLSNSDGIDIYYPPGLRARRKKIKIGLRGFITGKYLYIDGHKF